MLVKVRYRSTKKYIKLQSDFTYLDFITEVKNKFGFPDSTELLVLDESDTEIEEDVFLELMESNPDICLKILESVSDKSPSPMNSSSSSLTDTFSPSSDADHYSQSEWGSPISRRVSPVTAAARPNMESSESEDTKEMVKDVLSLKPGGEEILEEYKMEKSLSDRSRRQLVNILASEMTERHGRMPSRTQKEKYALGIVTLFPSLKDPFSPKGYEHFYDPEKGTGYLAWRLKTMSRSKFKRPIKEVTASQEQGPKRRRTATTAAGEQLQGDACREAISFLSHCTDESSVFQKMKMTIEYRQELVHDPERTTDVFKTFPRFLDIKGLVNQDFLLLFGAETASKMLEKWDTVFKPKVIAEAKRLVETTELFQLLAAAEKREENDNNWDSDMASLLLLLYLLPPTAGRKRTRISPGDAMKKLLHFHKSCNSLEGHLRQREDKQPYILAVGQAKNKITTFYIAIDKQLIPCQATSSLGAFDELFKAHYVFNLSYDDSLVQFFMFVQTTIFNIDQTTNVSPRLRELRAKIFN